MPDLLRRDGGEELLNTIGVEVCGHYRRDLESRQEWDKMHAEWLRMYFQTDRPINPPWQESSSESLPILSEANTQFTARAYKAIFPTGNLLTGLPIGKVDAHARSRGKRIGTHMRWQLLHKMKSYKRNKKRMLKSVALHGSFFTKTYYDPVHKMNRVDNIRGVDIVVPYGTGPRDVEDLTRWTHRIPMTVERSMLLERVGYLTEKIEPYKGSGLQKDQDTAHDEAVGLSESAYEEGMGLVFEQFAYFDIDEDGYPEPYTITVDANTKKVLRVQIGWETDEAGNPVNKFGMPVAKNSPDYLAPVNCLTHYVYMENPDGFYGLGQGHLLAQLNASVNKLTRQFVDSSTLAVVGNHSGFVSDQIAGPTGGVLEMVLGKFKKVSATAEEMAKGIYQFNFPGPNQSIIEAIQLLLGRADRLGSATEAITGQTEKVMQPTTVMALIEQGLQVFSDVYDGILESWTQELNILYRLNYKHMDPVEYFGVLDIPGEEEQMHAGREDYTPDFQVRPVADPKSATSQQRLQRGQMEYGILMQNPLVMNSPMHIYNATRTFLETIEAEDIDARLPNPGSQVGRVDDPRMENQLALSASPMISMVFPDQDHAMHLEAHIEELNDTRLTGLGRHLLAGHIESHRRMGNGAVGNTGMVPAGGDTMGIGSTPAEIPTEGMGGEILDGGSEGTVGTENGPGLSTDLGGQGSIL